MAKKKSEVNKSEEVRKLLKADPNISAKEVVTDLGKKGSNVASSLFYFVRGKIRGQKSRATKTVTTTSQKMKERITRLIRKLFAEKYPDIDPGQASYYWTVVTLTVLKRFSIQGILQAGTAAWPRVTKKQDDGVSATHFCYKWSPKHPNSIKSVAAGHLPEIHIWAAIPERNELIDMTTKFWPEQCKKIIGKDWPGVKPPDYFWSKVSLPPGVHYNPNVAAIEYILSRADEIKE